jgi:IS5 family transposase
LDKETRQEPLGHKNHVNVDKEHKLIRRYAVTDASVHDSQVPDELVDEKNNGRAIWADFAYRSESREEQMRTKGYQRRIHQKGNSRRRLNKKEQTANHRRSKMPPHG